LLNFGALPYRQNEVMESEVDISEIRKLGWQPRMSLADGLKKTIHTELEEGVI
jgi:nucleoside-diphosphate-sugar epimerase